MRVVSAIVAILLWALGCIGEQNPVYGEQPGTAAPTVSVSPLKLTNDNPSGSFPIATETVNAAPPFLSVSIIQVENPDNVAVELFVYLVRSEGSLAPQEKILVGQFSLFPPDHPARFTLRASNAFQKLQESRPASKSVQVRLLLELKAIRGKKPLPRIALTVIPPEWHRD